MKWILIFCCLNASARSSAPRTQLPADSHDAAIDRKHASRDFDYRATQRTILEQYVKSSSVQKLKALLDQLLVQLPDGGASIKADFSGLFNFSQQAKAVHTEKFRLLEDKMKGKVIDQERTKDLERKLEHAHASMDEHERNIRAALKIAATRANWKQLEPSSMNIFETKEGTKLWLRFDSEGNLLVEHEKKEPKGPKGRNWDDPDYFRMTGPQIFGQAMTDVRERSILLLPALQVNLNNLSQYQVRVDAVYAADTKLNKLRGMVGANSQEEFLKFMDGAIVPDGFQEGGFTLNPIRKDVWESLHTMTGLPQ